MGRTNSELDTLAKVLLGHEEETLDDYDGLGDMASGRALAGQMHTGVVSMARPLAGQMQPAKGGLSSGRKGGGSAGAGCSPLDAVRLEISDLIRTEITGARCHLGTDDGGATESEAATCAAAKAAAQSAVARLSQAAVASGLSGVKRVSHNSSDEPENPAVKHELAYQF